MVEIEDRQLFTCRPSDFDFASCATLSEMVDHFLQVRGHRVQLEADWWGNDKLTIEHACRRAMFMLGREEGRDRHQRPYSAEQLRRLGERLATAADRLGQIKSFWGLRLEIERIWELAPGRTPLLVYDVAHRLGYRLGLAPRHVYLHAGPRVGANALRPGLGDRRRRCIKRFPTSIQRLTPAQAEDFLCNARRWLHPGLWD